MTVEAGRRMKQARVDVLKVAGHLLGGTLRGVKTLRVGRGRTTHFDVDELGLATTCDWHDSLCTFQLLIAA